MDQTPLEVFISYSWDSREHQDRVLHLSDRLRAEGVGCVIDQYYQQTQLSEGWPRWMRNRLKYANFVLLVCTQSYYNGFWLEDYGGRGVPWEGAIITQQLYDEKTYNHKYLPVLFTESGKLDYIPEPLRSSSYYWLDRQYEDLYRHLTNQPYTPKPELGKRRTLPPRERTQDFVEASEVESNPENRILLTNPIPDQNDKVKFGDTLMTIGVDYTYDVALSFAGEDRECAEELAQALTDRNIKVFYDAYEEATLWGKNLYTHLSEVYQKEARFCVMFLSRHYASKVWTNHEREAAQARAFKEKKVYILPIRLDDTEIPGILPTIGYLRWSNPDSIAVAIVKKLEQETPEEQNLGGENAPFPPSLKDFDFKTPTVNPRGKIIKEDTKFAKYFTENLGNNVILEMVSIPGGKFLIGTKDEEIERLVQKFNNNDFRRERPQFEVTVKPFFIGKYSVTQAQWKIVAALPKVKFNLSADPSRFKGDNRPVERVSWQDAVEFCDRLSKHTKKRYRLPSEAEWEYACRAGTNTPFHFGETITTELANYNGDFNYATQTIEVGSFSPNHFGLYDMHGNVWEWCEDAWHENHEETPSDGSSWRNNDNPELHLLRGGSWYTEPAHCRSAFRNTNYGGPSDQYVGFRVVVSEGF